MDNHWYHMSTDFFSDGSCKLYLRFMGSYLEGRGIVAKADVHSIRESFGNPTLMMEYVAAYFELEQATRKTDAEPIWRGQWNRGDYYDTDKVLGLERGESIHRSHHIVKQLQTT